MKTVLLKLILNKQPCLKVWRAFWAIVSSWGFFSSVFLYWMHMEGKWLLYLSSNRIYTLTCKNPLQSYLYSAEISRLDEYPTYLYIGFNYYLAASIGMTVCTFLIARKAIANGTIPSNSLSLLTANLTPMTLLRSKFHPENNVHPTIQISPPSHE